MYLDAVPMRAHIESLIVLAMDYDVMPLRGRSRYTYLPPRFPDPRCAHGTAHDNLQTGHGSGHKSQTAAEVTLQ
jgi:hypothetical protein